MSVQVLCPNGRRVTVKLGPNAPLLYVVEQCCEKHGYDSSKHVLKHGLKNVDLSSPFRYSGLPNNAKLELVESETVRSIDKEMVQLVVQTEDGQRFSGSFSPSTTLHYILETHKLTGVEANAHLTIVYMRRQVSGERELKRTALKDLGLLGGRAILRLEKREGKVEEDTGSGAHNIEQSSHQTPSQEMKDRQTPSTEVDDTPSVERIEQSPSKKSKVQDTGRQEKEEKQDCTNPVIPVLSIFPQEEENAMEEEPDPCSRDTVIYHLDSVSATPNVEVSDDFFKVTIEDAMKIQHDLRQQVKQLNEAPLLTQAAKEKLKKSSSYSQTVIRIIFPDQWVLQGVFNTEEPVRALVLFVREHLPNPQVKFHLYTTPPKTVLKSGRLTLSEAGFVPGANIHFGFNEEGGGQGDSSPILSADSISQYSSTADKAEVVAQLKRSDSKKDDPSGSSEDNDPLLKETGPSTEANASNRSASRESGQSAASGSGKKIPKWLKLGQK
ncbi:PREDICTED: tether containing UBX domain for GLUT4-like [Amphimedon queenslandica]|uniref:UBX domain-containing protein n=1 Tax=Amphimedon queenslandica TaxID=400682 RepID=A0AAN0IVQ7_AMPQE|nr:PREDICTED: tether containing UBX domain for GLUT4-like [Amphimedon queenslandica]|eukprot:XP_011410468.1 PREDICTED: tether containing UBX domain for GLUT4-like [Amphimedon queenslandica]